MNVTFDMACTVLHQTLSSDSRRQITGQLSKFKSFKEALSRLREGMRSNVFKRDGGQALDLDRVVRAYDAKTAQDGFHVRQDWDGRADKLNEEIIPVDVLDFYTTNPREGPPNPVILSIFLDYYLVYILAVFCLRVWDEGNADENLERVTQLIHELQGPRGSGHHFVSNAETLMLVATSHFEPDEKAYERLLLRVRSLSTAHQVRIALSHAAILGSHLRHGFQDLYGRDLTTMRNDNGPDYPWLCFSVVTLMRAYARMREDNVQGPEREMVVEGIVNGLTADTRAFLAKPPSSLSAHEADVSEFRSLFMRYKPDLLHEFERHRPTDQIYSPIAFNFNFPHNLMKALVIDALLEAEGVQLTFNDLLTGFPRDEQSRKAKQALASTLMRYARFIPDRVKGKPVPVISYSPHAGLLSFSKTMSVVREQG